ncbi:exonuclease subunit SbcD [Candidatus Poribacteria bacterium]|nr:exonuclease subunit SbcD [Candidatus Poribacteria bacterium]MYB02306.1 exonuclease subunit SbcD [Candidatus Poribacteria bacterium]
MRILHTADWHIGQRLHERQRTDEHKAFLDWLLDTIQEHQVELLLVSGDIFDTALPSSGSTNLYYRFLYRLFNETDAYTVITAGNHDSARHLEAPREFLKMGKIYVVGLVAEPAGCVFPFPPDNPRVMVAAVPYLYETELPHVSYETEIEKSERYRERFKALYADCVAAMPVGLPKILMGHLFVQGGKISDSERNVQIGGATAVHASDFPEDVSYVALGHLHRPQAINGANYPIRYSGSPVPLRFNETGYRKKVYLLELSDDATLIRDEEIEIPIFKELRTVEGDEVAVLSQAMTGEWSGKYIQVKLKLDAPRVGISDEIRKAFRDRGGDVLSVEVELPETKQGPTIPVEDMKRPEEIFEQFHRANYDGNPPDEILTQTFSELVQIVEEPG